MTIAEFAERVLAENNGLRACYIAIIPRNGMYDLEIETGIGDIAAIYVTEYETDDHGLGLARDAADELDRVLTQSGVQVFLTREEWLRHLSTHGYCLGCGASIPPGPEEIGCDVCAVLPPPGDYELDDRLFDPRDTRLGLLPEPEVCARAVIRQASEEAAMRRKLNQLRRIESLAKRVIRAWEKTPWLLVPVALDREIWRLLRSLQEAESTTCREQP